MKSDDPVEVPPDLFHHTIHDFQRLKVAANAEPERYINAFAVEAGQVGITIGAIACDHDTSPW